MAEETRLTPPATLPAATPAKGLGARLLQLLLARIHYGELTIITPHGSTLHSPARLGETQATLHVHSWRTLMRLLTRGDLGFAKAYIDGDWSSPDLTAFLYLIAQNMRALTRYIDGLSFLRLFARGKHYSRRNTKRKSRKNILEHYDLGNDFYQLWLDDSMTYSSAYGMAQAATLEAAQAQKRALILKHMALQPDQSVLEIGCGWGALALDMAQAGARVTGITLSDAQHTMATRLLAASPVANQCDIRIQDYRDVQENFDHIVSIEMIEAVGEAYWPLYFNKLHQCVKPHGRVIVQAITIHEDYFEDYKRNTDFIQHYIFPGGMLPTKRIIAEQAHKAGLRITAQTDFGQDYAATLMAWKSRFLAQWPAIEALGFDAAFKRCWSYYFSYCAAGFQAGTIDVGLFVLEPA
jgi:cyclopropane-fatty-acyl-phospholipid synthase